MPGKQSTSTHERTDSRAPSPKRSFSTRATALESRDEWRSRTSKSDGGAARPEQKLRTEGMIKERDPREHGPSLLNKLFLS